MRGNSGVKKSAFVEAALGVDAAFESLEQIAGSLSRLELNSESSYDRARMLLERFSRGSHELTTLMVRLGEVLEARRAAADRAVQTVAGLAPVVQEKLLVVQGRIDRFHALAAQVQELIGKAALMGPAQVAARLRELTEEASALQEEARQAKLPSLERNCRDLRKSLKAVAQKLEGD